MTHTVVDDSGPPVINSPKKQYARYGKNGHVECNVRSLPKPDSISWLKDGQPMDLDKLERYKAQFSSPDRPVWLQECGRSKKKVTNLSVLTSCPFLGHAAESRTNWRKSWPWSSASWRVCS